MMNKEQTTIDEKENNFSSLEIANGTLSTMIKERRDCEKIKESLLKSGIDVRKLELALDAIYVRMAEIVAKGYSGIKWYDVTSDSYRLIRAVSDIKIIANNVRLEEEYKSNSALSIDGTSSIIDDTIDYLYKIRAMLLKIKRESEENKDNLEEKENDL